MEILPRFCEVLTDIHYISRSNVKIVHLTQEQRREFHKPESVAVSLSQ